MSGAGLDSGYRTRGNRTLEAFQACEATSLLSMLRVLPRRPDKAYKRIPPPCAPTGTFQRIDCPRMLV